MMIETAIRIVRIHQTTAGDAGMKQGTVNVGLRNRGGRTIQTSTVRSKSV